MEEDTEEEGEDEEDSSMDTN